MLFRPMVWSPTSLVLSLVLGLSSVHENTVLLSVIRGRQWDPRLRLVLISKGAALSPPMVGTSDEELYIWVILLTMT